MKNYLVEKLPAHFGLVDDQDLMRLATLWRVQVMRGNKAAQRIAHDLEVEQRRRYQLVSIEEQPLKAAPSPRPWWRLW